MPRRAARSRYCSPTYRCPFVLSGAALTIEAQQPPGGPDAFPWDPSERPRPAKRRGRRVALILLTIFAVLGACVAGVIYNRQRAYDQNIARIPSAFPTAANRPSAGAEGAENWLLVGLDRRSPADPDFGKNIGERADTIMLAHLSADHQSVQMVSIPRDSWVEIPGRGRAKINAAFAWGRSALLIETVEKLTGVRVDHFGIIDFEGMRTMTDALGGVDVKVSRSVRDPRTGEIFQAGVNHLNGERALAFVRQRYGLVGGDFDRIKRQQAFLKALARKAVSGGTLTNPLKLNAFLQALTRSVSLDDSMSGGDLRSLALAFRGVRSSDITFLTVPTKGTGSVGGQSVVFVDAIGGRPLYQALRTDRMTEYLAAVGRTNRVDKVR